jgi:hypothetical protein
MCVLNSHHQQGLLLLFNQCSPCSRITPRAVANLEDPAATLRFKDTSFLNNSHASTIDCYLLGLRRRQRMTEIMPAGVHPQSTKRQAQGVTVCFALQVCTARM